MRDLPFLMAQLFGHVQEDHYFESRVLKRIVATLDEAMTESKSSKKPFVVIGEHYGPSRGHIATPLLKYLAHFLLLVTIPEHNTSKLCPQCHCETEFATTWEIRSKVCRNCPVAGKDFYFDRDYGAASNMQYKTQFFVQSGGLYPAEYVSIKERKRLAKLFDKFVHTVDKVRSDSIDAGSRRCVKRKQNADANSASGFEDQ